MEMSDRHIEALQKKRMKARALFLGVTKKEVNKMPELEELKRRLCSLQKSPIYAKPAAAEEAIECAVRVLAAMDERIEKIIHAQIEFQHRLLKMEKGAGDGSEKN